MKKLITLLAACMLVIGFAGFASAACVTCEADPGHIARGCEGSQAVCEPFDYEDFGHCSEQQNSYCETAAKGAIHRALFKICDCLTDGTFKELVTGDTVDVSMQILVDKGNGMVTGDNGVYWAQDVNTTSLGHLPGVGIETFPSQADACAATSCDPQRDKEGDRFQGRFIYKTASNGVGAPYDGSSCALTPSQRVVEFDADPTQVTDQTPHGYTVSSTDAINGNSVWWIDIPELRADPTITQAGWKVYVKICLFNPLTSASVCGGVTGCCCTIYVGQLCCEEQEGACIYPYFPPANTTYWDLEGMTISNLSGVAGTATVTVFEADGDVGTVTVPLTAHGTFLTTISALIPTLTPAATNAGTLGDSKFYATVSATVPVHGFVMIANSNTGESMGYIPDCALGLNMINLTR